MPQIFKYRANALTSIILAGFALLIITSVAVIIALDHSPYATGQGATPTQLIPFSHEHHVSGLGIDCRYCHDSVEKSSFAGIPDTHTCMTCHSQVWTEADMLEPVRQSLEQGIPLVWTRVHDLADFTYFNHQAHVTNGVGCESCHGRVDQMPLISQAEPLTMEWCLDCHRDPGPRLREIDQITSMGYQPPKDENRESELLEQYDIHTERLTECVTCHR